MLLVGVVVAGARAEDTPRGSDALVKSLQAKGLSAGSIRNIYDAAARMFGSAVDDRVIPASPCRRIVLPTRSDQEVVPPTLEQVRAIDGAMGEQGAAVVVLAGSGRRIGELLGLQVTDVDLHSSAVITLRTYAHLWPGDDDRTRSIIDAVLGEGADQVRTRGD